MWSGQVVWYAHLFQNFPQFIVIHIVKGLGIVNKAEIDVFLELFCFFDDSADVGNLISGSSAFSKTSLNIWKFTVHGIFQARVGSGLPFLLQGIFPTQESNLGLPHCRQTLYHLSHQGSHQRNPKERQYQRTLKLLHNCTHLTR